MPREIACMATRMRYIRASAPARLCDRNSSAVRPGRVSDSSHQQDVIIPLPPARIRAILRKTPTYGIRMQDEDIAGDVVTDQWIARHGIRIPRAAGVFESGTAWVKINGSGVVVAAGERDQTVLAWLVSQKRLANSDIDYGIAYVTCRSAERAYRRQMGFKSSLDLSALSGGGGLSCEQAAQVFCLMRREIGPKLCAIVEYACDTVRAPGSPSGYNPPYRSAFAALAKAFDKAVQDVRDGKVSMEPMPKIVPPERKGLEKMLARSINE